MPIMAAKRFKMLKRFPCVTICLVACSLFLLIGYNTRATWVIFSGKQKGPFREFKEREQAVYNSFVDGIQAMKVPNDIGQLHVDTKRALASVHNALKPDGNIALGDGDNPIAEFLKWPVINKFNYKYSINQKRECVKSKTELLVVVPSAPGNFERRSRVRDMEYVKTQSNISRLFFIGLPYNDKNGEIQKRIENESRVFNDIIHVDFLDLYENIRLKSMSMLEWVITWCSEAAYVIRTDDDVTVNNMTELTNVLRKTHEKYTDFILGRKRVGDKPARIYDKYHLSYAEYSESTFPPFVVGGLVGFPGSTVRLLHQAALRLKPIWLDDVFITGMCAAQMGIPVLEDPEFTFKHTVPLKEQQLYNRKQQEKEKEKEKKKEKEK